MRAPRELTTGETLALPLTGLRRALVREAGLPQTHAASLVILAAAVLTALFAVAELARSVGAAPAAAVERPADRPDPSNSSPS